MVVAHLVGLAAEDLHRQRTLRKAEQVGARIIRGANGAYRADGERNAGKQAGDVLGLYVHRASLRRGCIPAYPDLPGAPAQVQAASSDPRTRLGEPDGVTDLRFDLVLKDRRRPNGVSVDDLSSGEIEALSMIGALIMARAGLDLMLVDEPELHLHPAWHRAILGKWGQTTFSIVWPKVQPEKRGLSLRCPHKIASHSHPTVYPDSSAS